MNNSLIISFLFCYLATWYWTPQVGMGAPLESVGWEQIVYDP